MNKTEISIVQVMCSGCQMYMAALKPEIGENALDHFFVNYEGY